MNLNPRTLRLALIVTALLLSAVVAAAKPPKINGKLDRIGDFRVLRVWGSPEEMGFAHGYLVGDSYLAPAKEYHSVPYYREMEKNRRKLLATVKLPDSVRRELRGIYDGIVAAAGKVPVIEGIGRPLEPQDLIFDNAADLFRAFACSGFTVWGERAGEAGLVTSRNFDYFVPGPIALQQQMILVRHPTGKNMVATITWPGLIIAFTGVNQHGVCAFVHDGDGPTIRRLGGQYTPLLLGITQFLENAKPKTAHALAESDFKKIGKYPFSYMVRVVSPRPEGSSMPPVRVFRLDADGLSENAMAESTCVTTNHYLDAALGAKDGAGGWSLSRYQTLTKTLDTAVTRQNAWEALRSVMAESSTLHSLVVYPESRELYLSMARWDDKLVPAPTIKPARISFDQLFADNQ